MRVLWNYELPILGDDAPSNRDVPLHWDGRHVLVPISRFARERDAQAADHHPRGYRIDVHRVTPDGSGELTSFEAPSARITPHWSFIDLAGDLVLHVETFHSLPGGAMLAAWPAAHVGDALLPGVFLHHGGALVFADQKTRRLFSFDARSKLPNWTLELRNTHDYAIGPVTPYHGLLACQGRDAMNFIDPVTGTVEQRQTFPRIARLFPPVDLDGDQLLAYTNWDSGGLLRFSPAEGRVRWKFTTRGRVSLPRAGSLPVVGGTAILSVNYGSSLVGVDLDTGKGRWKYRAQWLYTPVEIVGTSIIFGTSGGHGRHLRRHDAATGETEWAVEMTGGCTHYRSRGQHLLAGDLGGVLRLVRTSDGVVVSELNLGAGIITAPLVVGSRAMVLTEPAGGDPYALVAVEL